MKKAFIFLLFIVLASSILLYIFLQDDSLEQLTNTETKTKIQTATKNITSIPGVKNIKQQDNFKVLPGESCMDFRNRLPAMETTFNELMADIYTSVDDASDEIVFTNMDRVSLTALANGGDKDALFFLGDAISIKAIFGTDWYGPKEQRVKLSDEELKSHVVKLNKLAEGEDYLFKAGVFGKYGAFLNLKMNSEMSARQLIRTEPDSKQKIRRKLANMMAYNRLLSFIHKDDEPFRLMFSTGSKEYDQSQLERHYRNWRPDLSPNELSEEFTLINSMADSRYEKLKQTWVSQREFYGFDTHPKILEPKLEEYLMQISGLCWS